MHHNLQCSNCRDVIPEETEICPVCKNKMATLSNGVGVCACGSMSFPGAFIATENKIIFQPPPTVQSVRQAAKTIKNFCKNSNMTKRINREKTYCIECPIRDLCETDPDTLETKNDQ